MTHEPSPKPVSSVEQRWSALFLPTARPAGPDDHLAGSRQTAFPWRWLVIPMILLDLSVFAYVYHSL
ncbi:MAG: hypothetical protein QOH04_1006 [Sphingomonadales bacterium]|jgi:hypothetical protein|nr:hypothetical protein [Sphingomonadales bacterium]MEA3035247.1 hypothetical protein [Sphingomonadales bacterium]